MGLLAMVTMMMMTSGVVWIEHGIGTPPANRSRAGRGREQYGPRDPADRLMDRGRQEPVDMSCLGPSVPGQLLRLLRATLTPRCQPSLSIGVGTGVACAQKGGQGEIEMWRMSYTSCMVTWDRGSQ